MEPRGPVTCLTTPPRSSSPSSWLCGVSHSEQTESSRLRLLLSPDTRLIIDQLWDQGRQGRLGYMMIRVDERLLMFHSGHVHGTLEEEADEAELRMGSDRI